MGTDRGRLHALLARQGGVLSRHQALAVGVTPGQLRGLVRRGDWQRLHPQVYRAWAAPLTIEARIRAAALWTGGIVSGAAAAWWWGFTAIDPGEVEMIISPGRCVPSGRNVRVTRRELDQRDLAWHRGLAVVARPYAAALGAAAYGPAGREVFDRAGQRGVSVAAAAKALDRNPRARGAGLARCWIKAADRTAAETERTFLALMRRAGIGPWLVNEVVHTSIGRVIPDCRLDGLPLAIELDGWAFHSTPDRFTADRRRQNVLVLAGFLVLRFTWADLSERPKEVVAEVRAAIFHLEAQRPR